MKSVLMVAEKPSLAQSLAEILSNKKCSTRKGFNGACSIHEWTGSFVNQPVRFKMTSVCGHVMSLDFPGKFNNWDRVDPAELFKCPTEKKEATPKLKMPDFLSKEARGCDYLVLWLDCDKEGENICFEVISCVEHSMNRPSYREQTVFRAKFSAITERDIKAAMNTLVEPNENESRSVDARQELDLRIGCAFTRYQTKFFQGKYGNLDSTLISFGPCQTPTLGFCVERHDFIQSFKPETYWVLQIRVAVTQERQMTLEWERVRSFDKDVANMFLNMVKEHKKAKVVRVDLKEKAKPRPPALNTVELMRVASSGLGMGPHHAMTIAERLYTQGYISYPRTETTHYPENFDLKGALRIQDNHSDWGHIVRDILKEGIQRPKKGHDAGDHPPITPMRCADKSQLDHDSWRLYEYITKHFIGSLMPDCIYMSTTIIITIASENFTISGKQLIDPGFTKVMDWLALQDEESLPDVRAGDEITIMESKLAERQTSPPDYLTEAELISLMEKHGIGTDASIPVHINNISQRNYVTVSSGRRLVPTNLGIVLVHGYQKIDPDLVLPTMRSAVEEQLNLIALGKADFNSVLHHTLEIFQLKFHYFVKNIQNMDELFEVSFSPLSASGRPLSRCGKCRRYLKLVETKPVRLHCMTCDETFAVPQNGVIREFQENRCPLDDFQLLMWSGGAKGKSYTFCPYCYNNPPFPDMSKGWGCNICPHPTCHYSRDNLGISQCMECPTGILVLDPSSGPKWKLACNRCDVIINLFDKASRVQVLEDVCDDCGSQCVTVEYREGKSKLKDGQLTATGCIFCSCTLTPLVEKHRASQESGRGRGRGRGGRGRGGPRGGRGGGRGSRGRGGGRGRR
ncbi:DNA topoisomerase 3-beta-1-like [Macrobrachium nipponense]|uniref:DNA topoisomerase 3-beta-1-like n=1 Tax=Macrobrachium nipponense TaxID=159736 RepID=UPI0030C86D5D